MLIAVQAMKLAHDRRGMGRYVRALLPRLLAARDDVELELFAKPADMKVLGAMWSSGSTYHARVRVRPVRELTRTKADVIWYPWNIALPMASRAPVVVTVHDVAPLVLPDRRPSGWGKNLSWWVRYRWTARRGTMFIADSQFTANEMTRVLGIPAQRIRVVLLAADDRALSSAQDDGAELAALGVQRPFVLTVGAADRRKNVDFVRDAMTLVRRTLPGTRLVLAGPRKHASRDDGDADTRTLGFVSDRALVALYRTASCLVVPSRYEGFGLPVLEAMQMGTPVLCARTSSLPEVGGDAVLWFDPDDARTLATLLTDVLGSDVLRRDLRERGIAQAERFTWDDTARRTVAVFEEAQGV